MLGRQVEISWVGEVPWVYFSIVLADVWQWTPFMFVILLAGLAAIPPHLYEAAELDGVGAIQTFRYVTLPQLAPVMLLAVTLRLLDAVKLFDVIFMLTGGARTQPIVLAFEDLHWADPTSLDLLRALAKRGGQAPLFIVATTRPEFRSSWDTLSHHSVISLAPLDSAQVRKMVGEIASRHALSKDVVEGVEQAHGRRATLRRGGHAPASRARRTGRGSGDPADAPAIARGAPRPVGPGA